MSEHPGLRIGDTDRDAAVTALGEHYAAGRLTKDEYDERTARVWAARFEDDIDPLFDDLPRRTGSAVVATQGQPGRAPWTQGGPGGGRPPLWVFPLALLAIGAFVSLAALIGPWVLFGLFWFAAMGGMGRRHAWHGGRSDWRGDRRGAWSTERRGDWRGDWCGSGRAQRFGTDRPATDSRRSW